MHSPEFVTSCDKKAVAAVGLPMPGAPRQTGTRAKCRACSCSSLSHRRLPGSSTSLVGDELILSDDAPDHASLGNASAGRSQDGYVVVLAEL